MPTTIKLKCRQHELGGYLDPWLAAGNLHRNDQVDNSDITKLFAAALLARNIHGDCWEKELLGLIEELDK